MNFHLASLEIQNTVETLKLYCGYEYTMPCVINRIWGLKTTMTTSQWQCLISFAWDPLSCSEQAGIEKFKKKYISPAGFEPSPRHATTGEPAL